MMTYFIKTTVCLLIFYGFYHFFLQPYKILIFNRFYLISTLIISMIIPLIIVPIESGFTITDSLNKFTIPINQKFQYQEISEIHVSQINYQNIITILFIAISAIILIRYVINIYRLIRKTNKNKKIENPNSILILVEEDSLPYSFFKYVFVNKSDFEKGKIEKELLVHEEAHCSQYHSIDIVFLELLNVFLWFNPAIWLYRKAILLNHEYYADNTVLSNNKTCDYPQLLVNLVVQNNSYSLVSNIKNTLIKNRLIMMTESKPLHNAVFRKIAGVSLILLIGVTFTLCQADKLNNGSSDLMPKSSIQQGNISDQWWSPIVSKHGIKNDSYTVHDQFVIFGNKTTTGDIESYTDVVAISNRNDSTYCIYKSNIASYDNKNKMLNINDCTMNIFELYSNDTEPVKSYTNINFRVDFNKSIYLMANSGKSSND
jgi:beta-lactamase regulating signal transducer with metallopeptidase domain